MGILEVHFHESDFSFSPSVGPNGDIEELSDDDGTMLEPEEDSGNGGAGALVALGVLVALGMLIGLRRRSSGGEDDGERGEEEEISISA